VSDGLALLAAILAAPDDDQPRLVYADWCDENGEPGRAEFVRWQIANPGRIWDYDRGEPAWGLGGVDTSWDGIGGQCYSSVVSWAVATVGVRLRFERGFCCEIRSPAGWWLREADALLARHPVVEVRLTTMPDDSAVELSNPVNTEPRPRMRWRGGREWVEVSAGFPTGAMIWTRMLLRAEWPAVRTWHLPES
jgi:uncharacterized protein (TIGR02996 family)